MSDVSSRRGLLNIGGLQVARREESLGRIKYSKLDAVMPKYLRQLELIDAND